MVGAPPSQQEALTALVLSKLAYAQPDTLRAWQQADTQACSVCPLCTQVGLAVAVSLAANAALGVQAFVLQPAATTMFGAAVSFRGTVISDSDWANSLVDFAFRLVPYAGCRGCRVHEGFLAAYTALAPAVLVGVQSALPLSAAGAMSEKPLLVTGHSLGGAMATIAAFELALLGYNVRLITFGSPRVGNAEFASAITSALTTHRGVLMGASSMPLPAGVSPLRRRGLQYPELAGEVDNESAADAFVRPSAVLHAVAERLCGAGCGGFFAASGVNDTAYAVRWNEYIAGRSSLPASARKLQGGGAAPASRELWNMWRYVNSWDPVPALPPSSAGYVHVPAEIFFTGTASDGWGLIRASASIVAPPTLADYSTVVPTSAYESAVGRLAALLESDHGKHYHDLSEYAYRLLDPVYLRGQGSSSVGFWGPAAVDAAARPLGNVYGRAQGLIGYTCPSLAPSASSTAWSRPTCNYAPVGDSTVSIALSSQALDMFRFVRTVTAAARATLSLSSAAAVNVETLGMAFQTVAAAYTGSSPAIVLGTLRRLAGGVSSNISFELSWNFTKRVASAWLPAANESLLSDSDLASFDDALFFAQQHANATLARLDDMLSGTAPPHIDCDTTNATLIRTPMAVALGCGLAPSATSSSSIAANPFPPLLLSIFAAAACNISVPEALALQPVVVFSTAAAFISSASSERLEAPKNNTAIGPGEGFSAGAVSGFVLAALTAAALAGCVISRALGAKRVVQKKVLPENLLPPEQQRPPPLVFDLGEDVRPSLRPNASSRSSARGFTALGSQRSLRDVSSTSDVLRIGDFSVLPSLSFALSGSLRSAAESAAATAPHLPGLVPEFSGGAPLTPLTDGAPPPLLPPLEPKLAASMRAHPLFPAHSGRSRAFLKHAAATLLQSTVRGFLSRRHMWRFRTLVSAALEEHRARQAKEALLVASREAQAAAAAAAEAEAAAAAEAAALVAAEAAVAAAEASASAPVLEAAAAAEAEAMTAAIAEAARREAAAATAAEREVVAEISASAAAAVAAEALAAAGAAVEEQEDGHVPLPPSELPHPSAYNSGAALLMSRVTAPADTLSTFMREEAQRVAVDGPAAHRLANARAAAHAAADKEQRLASTAAEAERRAKEAESLGRAVLSAEWAASLSRAAAARARLLETRVQAARGGTSPVTTFRRF